MEIISTNNHRGDYLLSTLETSLDSIVSKYNLHAPEKRVSPPLPSYQEMSSRTAALSRYLKALDSPPPPNNNNSVGQATTATPEVMEKEPNEFEALFPNNDLYSGNKVVAMPSLGGKSVREVVSSRNVTPGRPRSRSAGRVRDTPRSSRDLVQDVYDRMGVSRDDLTTDVDKFAERYRAAAALSATASATQQQQQASQQAVSSASRGRTAEPTDGERRARSLSRGRVSGRWPPARSSQQQQQPQPMAVARPNPTSPHDLNNKAAINTTSAGESAIQHHQPQLRQPPPPPPPQRQPPPPPPPPREVQPTAQQQGGNPVEDITATSRINRSSSYPDPIPPWKRPSSSTNSKQQTNNKGGSIIRSSASLEMSSTNTTTTTTSPSGEMMGMLDHHYPDEELTAAEAAAAAANKLSVKDRVKTLSGGKSNRNFKQRTYPVQYVKRDHPPPIDIFKEVTAPSLSSLGEEQQQQQPPIVHAPEPSNIPPSPAAAAAADAAAELVRKNYNARRSNNNATTTPSSTTRSAGNTPSSPWNSNSNNKPPPVEIAGADESGGVADLNSVAVSSVSTDDFPSPVARNNSSNSNMGRSTSGRSWQSPKARSYNNNNNNTMGSNSKTTHSNSLTADQIERIIEERVQVQLSELETRMENQMLRLEGRMEDRITQRMDSLEQKMDKIGTMLTAVVQQKNNNRREI